MAGTNPRTVPPEDGSGASRGAAGSARAGGRGRRARGAGAARAEPAAPGRHRGGAGHTRGSARAPRGREGGPARAPALGAEGHGSLCLLPRPWQPQEEQAAVGVAAPRPQPCPSRRCRAEMPPAVPPVLPLLLPLLLLAAARPAAPPHRPTFTCGGVVSGESGFIGSEGFPGVYPPNSKCTWKITVPEGKVVVLSFRYLDLESDALCRYDFVDIYSGHGSGQRIGRFCGTVKPGALVSSSNKMLVQMTSDANTAGSGFIAKFSAAEPHERGDQYCGGRLEKPSGSFHTPNWPERDYPAGVTCSWHIVAPKNQLIELKFEKFDVERDNYCRYDYVSVFNGGEINDAKRIGKYCGDSPPAPILSEKNELLIQFLSDLSLTADGFIGHYKFRPKKLPTTTALPTTTTVPPTSTVKPTVALCQQKCKRSGTLESNYCSSNFVITGTVITTVPRAGSLHATISIINVYKEGNLAIQQAGKNMSAKILVMCKQCPLIRRGLNYIIMGQVEEDGRGKVYPNSFVMSFKTKNSKILNALKNKTCQN
ncbi:procollagen C-endopeptidase enhancer 2 [Zonotrichia albicollis]|uniref:procollagen C-endopeptidase enhancer 2 n=1 Tax=Zonotrichia albicollis TaxID=44394 RepID=UPI003D80C9C9